MPEQENAAPRPTATGPDGPDGSDGPDGPTSPETEALAASPTSGDPVGGDVLVLTEEALTGTDAQQVVELHAAEDDLPAYRVLVPADTERNLLADVVDHLSLFELREALDAVRAGRPEQAQARRDADGTLRSSLEALRGAGAAAEGEVVADDPLPALERSVAVGGVREVVVVTRPHAVEDTFHRDWASRAREALGVPVLHLYGGTTKLG